MHAAYPEPSSLGGMVAAWAGSITLHAAVILGLHWAAPSLAPVPRGLSELQVTVIESVGTIPPAIQSSETTDSHRPRVVIRPSSRMTLLTPPAVVSRTREITTLRTSAVEVRPISRVRGRTGLPTKDRQRSVVDTRRVDSVEPGVAIVRRPAVPQADHRGIHTIGSAARRTIRRGVESTTALDTTGGTKSAGLDGRLVTRFPEGESVRTVASPASVTVRNPETAASRPPVKTGPDSTPSVIRTDSGTGEVRVLDQLPSQVGAADSAASGASKVIEEEANTRMVQIMRPRAEHRVTRTAPALASRPAPHRSRGGSSDTISDYGWLAQAVHRRIAELKRYPQAARANQWEGRVVLRAVIREDGELAALSVRTTSGHHELDQEAMRLVREICPVPLAHPLGRPEITMHIPISYKLDR